VGIRESKGVVEGEHRRKPLRATQSEGESNIKRVKPTYGVGSGSRRQRMIAGDGILIKEGVKDEATESGGLANCEAR